MDVRLPDGTIIRGVPDGTTREEVMAFAKSKGISFDEPKREPGRAETAMRSARLLTPAGAASALFSEEGREDLKNVIAGGVRGAGSIGATLIRPFESGDENQQRRAAMDEALTTMGADTQSVPFQMSKIGTEVGATYPVGGIVGRGVRAVAPRLGQAITSGGMTTGARVAPGVVPQTVDLATRATGGAISGGLSAGLINPEDAGLGATIGGSVPVVTRVAGAVGNTVGSVVSPRMARNTATQKVTTTLGDDASQAVADIQTHLPKGAEDIPLSAAAITRDPRLAQLEQGSRLRNSPAWFEFDQRQGKAVFDNVMRATGEADELGKRAGERGDNWKAAWEKASENFKPRLWQQRMTQFGADMETALRSPDASNPNVRQVLEAINAEMDRVGPDFSIGHLQQLRANLNGKVQPMSPDVFKSAPRDNPAIISIKKEMDDILNTATGGKWQKVLEGYSKDSEKLHASKAASKVRGSFIDRETGRVAVTALDPKGEIPRITEAGLNRSMNAARLPDGSLALSPESNNRLMATMNALRAQNVVQQVKKSASAGGGSDTIPNAIAMGAREAGTPNMLLQLIDAVRRAGTGKVDNELALLLSNPDELAAALQRWGTPRAPNALALGLSRSAPALAADR